MNKEKIILVGGGGHCRSVIDVIETENRYEIIGILDRVELVGQKVLSYPIIASDNDIETVLKNCQNFFITVGHIKTAAVREKLFNSIKEKGGHFPIIISPKAHVSKHACLSEGTVVMHHAVVNTLAVTGKNCIINTGAVLEHDVQVGDHCHISTGAYINGECKIGSGSFVGSNATTVQTIHIGDRNVIAAGAVLTKNTEDFSLYAGNPATLKKKLN
jgi:sugar O-acyltransferase (sialic acid O-acetyltransferase NeuD family)